MLMTKLGPYARWCRGYFRALFIAVIRDQVKFVEYDNHTIFYLKQVMVFSVRNV